MLRKLKERRERVEVGRQRMRIRCQGDKLIRGLWQRQIFVAKLVSSSNYSINLFYHQLHKYQFAFIFNCHAIIEKYKLLVSELFLELSSCLRFPTESNVEEQVQHRHVHPGLYSANQLVLTVENRDSMAFLAAVFTGNCFWSSICHKMLFQ